MSAPKTRNAWGFAAKIESAYATINATGVGDGILTTDVPEVTIPQFLNDGSRGNTPGGGPRPHVNRSGRFGAVKFGSEGHGAAAAYAAGVKPHHDVLLRASGLAAAGSFGAGVEKWQYTPLIGPTGLESLTIDSYVAGQLYRLYGAYGAFEVAVAGPAVPTWDYEFAGIADPVTDVAIPTFTSYPTIANAPPKAENITLTFGTGAPFITAKVRSFHFVQGRKHDQARADINAGAPSHAGFTPGEYDPVLDVVFERLTLKTASPWYDATTFNPYKLAEDKNLLQCSLAVGSVQYKRWKLWSGPAAGVAAQAQFLEVQDGWEGPTAIWTAKIAFMPSTHLAQDAFCITYD